MRDKIIVVVIFFILFIVFIIMHAIKYDRVENRYIVYGRSLKIVYDLSILFKKNDFNNIEVRRSFLPNSFDKEVYILIDGQVNTIAEKNLIISIIKNYIALKNNIAFIGNYTNIKITMFPSSFKKNSIIYVVEQVEVSSSK